MSYPDARLTERNVVVEKLKSDNMLPYDFILPEEFSSRFEQTKLSSKDMKLDEFLNGRNIRLEEANTILEDSSKEGLEQTNVWRIQEEDYLDVDGVFSVYGEVSPHDSEYSIQTIVLMEDSGIKEAKDEFRERAFPVQNSY